MQNNEFGAFIAQLGALTIVQRKALLKALSFNGSSDDVVRLIETEFAKAPTFGHCGSKEFGKWGTATAMKLSARHFSCPYSVSVSSSLLQGLRRSRNSLLRNQVNMSDRC